MIDPHTKFIGDLLVGMHNSCYEYNVDEIFEKGENKLIIDVMCESVKNDKYNYEL
jgi:hypothetical protein